MSRTSSLILALDIGTSSVRAALYDGTGNLLPDTTVKNERLLTATDEGGAEIDAEEAFGQVTAAIDDVLKSSEEVRGDISHVATSAFWHSLVGVDAKGNATTKVLGWADTQSRGQVARLRKNFDEAVVHNTTGARFHPSYLPAKLLWLRTEFPDAWNKTTKWLSLSDLVEMRFSGEPRTSISMASATGILDIRTCSWNASLLRFLKLKPDNLPGIALENCHTFALNAKFAKRWPRLKPARWFHAIGDGAANNIGAGCVEKTQAALMIGTSGALRVAYRGEPPDKIPAGLWCYRIDRERVIVGGALSDGGGLYRWLKENLRIDISDDTLEAEIAKRPPAGHGLTFLPFLAGERSTGYSEYASGAILGLKGSTDAIYIVQAALESVAYRFADIFDQLNSVVKISEITASGGALRESPVWTQIISDVLGRKLSLADTGEASSLGAVLLALESIGRIDGSENNEKPLVKAFSPDRAKKNVYKQARQRHEKFYDLILKTNL